MGTLCVKEIYMQKKIPNEDKNETLGSLGNSSSGLRATWLPASFFSPMTTPHPLCLQSDTPGPEYLGPASASNQGLSLRNLLLWPGLDFPLDSAAAKRFPHPYHL